MREDQYLRLQALSEKLAEAFIEEADPATWTGAGKAPSEMDKAERGDRYWCKRNAAATGGLLLRVGSLVSMIQRDSSGNGGAGEVGATEDEDGDGGLEAEVTAAEKEGRRLLDQVMKQQRRAAEVAKIHGKP